MDPKKADKLCLVYRGVFGHFPTISNYLKISEDYRRLTKMCGDYRRCQKTAEDFKNKSENFRLHFCRYIHMGKKYIFAVYRFEFFQGDKSL